MYRKMTAEEKLAFSAEIINAIKEEGLEGSLKVVEKYEKKLLIVDELMENEETNENISKNSKIEAPTPTIEEPQMSNELPKEASIYATEHFNAVVEDNQNLTNQESSAQVSHAKTRILTNSSIPSAHQSDESRKTAPSMYQDAVVVEPGYFNNSNKML